MRHQETRQMVAQFVGGEGREIPGVALEVAGAGAGRQTARANRPTLAAPIETPYRDPARRQIAYRLELLFDELAKAADHHTLGPRVAHRQVAPAQHRAIGRGKAAPDKTLRRQKAFGQRRRPRGWPAERPEWR